MNLIMVSLEVFLIKREALLPKSIKLVLAVTELCMLHTNMCVFKHTYSRTAYAFMHLCVFIEIIFSFHYIFFCNYLSLILAFCLSQFVFACSKSLCIRQLFTIYHLHLYYLVSANKDKNPEIQHLGFNMCSQMESLGVESPSKAAHCASPSSWLCHWL